ncbi:MAG: Aldose 1-epimerase, partial [Xanthobacteraceae bacterium]|nr:Aldose 1-epimerase [Xanthobacteraceae bacterium]
MHATAHTSRLLREPFGTLSDGRAVERFRLVGEGGFEVAIITHGTAVQALHVPDRDGRVADIVLGHDDLAPYEAHRRYFGAAIGRYANRIAGGRFTLDGVPCHVPANNGANALHGGPDGFDRRLWSVAALTDRPMPSVTLSLVSSDGDQGFPGELDVRVTYALTGSRELSITFEATTSRPTFVNLTHHGFFNLAGVETGGDVLGHELTLHADAYLPIDTAAIPVGGPTPVAGTPFDFRNPRLIGARIREAHEQLRLGRGYDHNFCLTGGRTAEPRLAARVAHPA